VQFRGFQLSPWCHQPGLVSARTDLKAEELIDQICRHLTEESRFTEASGPRWLARTCLLSQSALAHAKLACLSRQWPQHLASTCQVKSGAAMQ
jgi:hypothetical protein